MFPLKFFRKTLSLKPSQIFLLLESVFHWPTFSNGKQTQKSLESDFPETTFRKTNTAKRKNTFLKTKPNFSLTEKCFLLTRTYFLLTRKCFSLINFFNDKQTRENLKKNFLKIIFRKTNMAEVSCAIQERLVHKCSKFSREHNLRCQCFLCEAGV